MSHYRSQKTIPDEAKRYAVDSLSSSESEEESNESYHSDESSSLFDPPLPVRHYSNRYGTPPRDKEYHEVKRRPSLGVAMQNRQFRRFSTISSSTNSTNEDEFDKMAQYTAINKPSWRENHRLERIQELSPIQPCLASSSPRDFAPPPPLSREMREWRPKHTSSVINVPTSFPMLPKTNPLHAPSYFPSPRTTKNSLELQPYDELLDPARKDFISDMSSDSSYLDLQYPKVRRGIITSSPRIGRGSSQPGRDKAYRLTCEIDKPVRPEDFHLPGPVAKVWKARGIVFLKVELFNGQLFIYVERAAYFSENCRRKDRSTYITLEMNHKSRDRGESSRKRSSQRHVSTTTQIYRTKTVESTDEPVFNKKFTFNLTERNQRDSITISVMEKEIRTPEMNRRKQLGCFTFHISQILKKAAEKGRFMDDENSFAVQLIDDGYFILDPEKGRTKNFPMSKIIKSTNYTLDGPSSTSSSSLNVHSPQKMLRSSEWPASSSVSSHLPSRSSSAIPPPPSHLNDHRTRPRPFSYMEGHHHQRHSEDVRPSTESFGNSTGSSSVDYDFNRHRMTLPSITTTSSSITSDEGPSCSSSAFNSSFLHPGGGGENKNGGKSEETDRKPSRQEGGVRRAASFTYSPTGSQGKHNRRPEAVVGKEDEAAKKKLFGGLSKMFSTIGSKIGSAMSTSSLFPSKDEIRQWEHSFEALLNHKYGQMLFSQFLETEHSSENLEFWLECEKYKKMEDGKKMTTKANEIYTKFIAPLSTREVNLDSDTRAATKAAMESGCRPDTFTLAQGKIEHLMATDTYRRFLKHKIYQDVANHVDGKSGDESTENGSTK